MIYVVATLTIKPGSLAALRAPAAACVAATRAEAGCLGYDLHVSLEDEQRLVFVEAWTTREALSAHARSPHLAAWRAASAPHLVERRIDVIHADKVETF